MEIVPITDATHVLAKDQPEYRDLPVRVEETDDGDLSMTSQWKPSKEEIQQLVDGGYIQLTVLGGSHPPVKIETAPQ